MDRVLMAGQKEEADERRVNLDGTGERAERAERAERTAEKFERAENGGRGDAALRDESAGAGRDISSGGGTAERAGRGVGGGCGESGEEEGMYAVVRLMRRRLGEEKERREAAEREKEVWERRWEEAEKEARRWRRKVQRAEELAEAMSAERGRLAGDLMRALEQAERAVAAVAQAEEDRAHLEVAAGEAEKELRLLRAQCSQLKSDLRQTRAVPPAPPSSTTTSSSCSFPSSSFSSSSSSSTSSHSCNAGSRSMHSSQSHRKQHLPTSTPPLVRWSSLGSRLPALPSSTLPSSSSSSSSSSSACLPQPPVKSSAFPVSLTEPPLPAAAFPGNQGSSSKGADSRECCACGADAGGEDVLLALRGVRREKQALQQRVYELQQKLMDQQAVVSKQEERLARAEREREEWREQAGEVERGRERCVQVLREEQQAVQQRLAAAEEKRVAAEAAARQAEGRVVMLARQVAGMAAAAAAAGAGGGGGGGGGRGGGSGGMASSGAGKWEAQGGGRSERGAREGAGFGEGERMGGDQEGGVGSWQRQGQQGQQGQERVGQGDGQLGPRSTTMDVHRRSPSRSYHRSRSSRARPLAQALVSSDNSAASGSLSLSVSAAGNSSVDNASVDGTSYSYSRCSTVTATHPFSTNSSSSRPPTPPSRPSTPPPSSSPPTSSLTSMFLSHLFSWTSPSPSPATSPSLSPAPSPAPSPERPPDRPKSLLTGAVAAAAVRAAARAAGGGGVGGGGVMTGSGRLASACGSPAVASSSAAAASAAAAAAAAFAASLTLGEEGAGSVAGAGMGVGLLGQAEVWQRGGLGEAAPAGSDGLGLGLDDMLLQLRGGEAGLGSRSMGRGGVGMEGNVRYFSQGMSNGGLYQGHGQQMGGWEGGVVGEGMELGGRGGEEVWFHPPSLPLILRHFLSSSVASSHPPSLPVILRHLQSPSPSPAMSTAAVGPAPLPSDPVPGNAPAGKTGLESVMTAAEGRGCLTADSFMVPRGDLQLTDHQKELVAEARELISQSGISTDDVDDRTVMRFLVARALTPAKAAPLYVAHRKWRAAYIPKDAPTVPMESIRTQAASDLMCLQTLPGHASWLLIRPRFHDPNTRNLDEFVRLIVYGMDAALGSSRAAGFHKCGVIIDMEGLAYRNLDTRGVIAAIAVLQNQYPERLICLFLIHVPTIFWTLWKLVSPFIDPITKKKFRFLEDRAIDEILQAAIPRKQLPSRYGGEGEFTPIRTVQVDSWPSNTE
ncbi:unnamed protein product [Closterium sp. Naga37s-1]|nr:unnamed protein product [Closterium sp. Naga37s-1]